MIKNHPTQKATGFDDFCKVTSVRDHILEHAENQEAGIAAVAQYIHKQWLTTNPHHRSSLINRLMRQEIMGSDSIYHPTT